ncbi:Olfactory receptor 5M3 [Heterocephalus glaber]|uniref:Olfactory receptor 5M3 n=1 Tax=Heterocephalus glaber TaxID=10181 RepID=G5AJP8_HETGA|nr:Olfactory receptor 5M3 [Heterocephalus glaber]
MHLWIGFKKMLNFTDVTEFILLGLTSRPELQLLLFVVFLLVYTVTLLGNIGMIILIQISPQLSSPMYFFLSHLSFADVWFSSNVTPKMLESLVSEIKTISYAGCIVQCFFFIAFVHVEVFILAVMAFDRYMAIGNPLLYGSRMSRTVCVGLISFPCVWLLYQFDLHTVDPWSPTEESVGQGKMVAVFYTMVIPMLNPMIYSLRNKDVKEAMNKAISRIFLTK